MCFFNSKQADPPPPPPPPPAPPAPQPMMTNLYDPSNPESGMAMEKGAQQNKAKGTSQLQVNLDPTVSNMSKGTGLQITK